MLRVGMNVKRVLNPFYSANVKRVLNPLYSANVKRVLNPLYSDRAWERENSPPFFFLLSEIAGKILIRKFCNFF